MIFMVRHGETTLSGTFCGSSNPRLTSQGRSQAQKAASLLSQFPIEVCFSSPLLRAKQTASIISRRLAVPHIIHPDLREIHFGAWEGLPFQDIDNKWPALAKQWARDPMKVRIPDSETFLSLRKRIKHVLGHLEKTFLNRTVLMVAHGGALSAMVLELLRLPNKEFPKHIQPPGSIRMVHGRTLKWIHPVC